MTKEQDDLFFKALNKFSIKSYAEAFKLFDQGYKNGDLGCSYFLALSYRSGFGVKKDKEKYLNIINYVKPIINLLADNGDAISNFIVGYELFRTADEVKAMGFLKLSAQKLFAPSDYLIAEIYSFGKSVPRNETEAFNRYKRAAKSGFAIAQYNVACCYFEGKGVAQNYGEAFKWFEKAAKQGYAEAQYNLSNCYFQGIGVKEDKYEAFKWFLKAARQGVPLAQFNVACYYSEGKVVAQNYEEAFEWCEKAAKQGHVSAQNSLGACYLRGRGVEQDNAKAVEWFEKAADKGLSIAQFNLGYCYENGKGVEQDYAKAVELYKKAAEQGYADAQNCLGYCYATGNGVEQDYAKAVEWYQKAAEQGHAVAQCNLAKKYYYGKGVNQDYAKAVDWFKKSACQGYADAQFYLGLCYENGRGIEQDDNKAVEWYKKSAEQGDADAQNNLGVCYVNGRGVEQDYAKAFEWYKKSAEQGDVNAQYNLAVSYALGGGVEQDSVKAFEFYKKAAEQGHINAQFYVGVSYDFGEGVEQDFAQAFEWYEKAAKQGHAHAQFNLGNCYDLGEGVEQDCDKAVEWYKKAVENSSAQPVTIGRASFALAEILGELTAPYGTVNKDNVKAAGYYERAIANGYPCKRELEQLKKLIIGGDRTGGMPQFVEAVKQTANVSISNLKAAVEDNLKRQFKEVWNLLQRDTKQILTTACFDYITRSMGDDCANLDYSPIIIELAKACEIELSAIFFNRFLEYLKKNNISPDEFDFRTQKFVYRENKQNAYVKEDSTGKFTLGGIDNYFGVPEKQNKQMGFSAATGSGDTDAEGEQISEPQEVKREVDKHIVDFMCIAFKSDAFPVENRREEVNEYLLSLVSNVRKIARNLRNPSAHTNVMGYTSAEYCAKLIIMGDGLLYDFISKIKPEYLKNSK